MKLLLLAMLGMGGVGAAVHTTGINWDSLLAVSASVTTLITIALIPLGRMFLKALKEAQRAATEEVIEEKVLPWMKAFDKRLGKLEDRAHDNDIRLSRLEGIREGQASALVMHEATKAARATLEDEG